MKRYFSKAEYLKDQFSEALELFNKGLISNIERLFIQMQVFKELAKYYRSVGMFKSFERVTKEVSNIVNMLRIEAPQILTA